MSDVLDLLTLNEAKQAINMDVTNTGQDAVLTLHVTTVSRIIDDMCGPVVQRTVTAERHQGGQVRVTLRRRPVISITQVREDRQGTIQVLPAAAFGDITDAYSATPFDRNPALLSGELIRVLGGFEYVWWPGVNNVEVTYVAGRFANTGAVDARFKDAAGAVMRRLWKREAGSWAQSADFWNQETHEATPGFFKVAAPVISELLAEDVQNHVLGFA